jgi:hypothetical protein
LHAPDLIDRCCGLERYLCDATIELVRPLEGGGGHPDKMTLVLQGGVGVAAKAGSNEIQLVRAKREVAAWLLACELGVERLVPATVLREVPAPAGTVEPVAGSVQVLWPRFLTSVKAGVSPSECPAEVSWPVGIFDMLAANTDRNAGNWGIIDQLPHIALIDHGHAFESAASSSEFATKHQGQAIPADLLE